MRPYKHGIATPFGFAMTEINDVFEFLRALRVSSIRGVYCFIFSMLSLFPLLSAQADVAFPNAALLAELASADARVYDLSYPILKNDPKEHWGDSPQLKPSWFDVLAHVPAWLEMKWTFGWDFEPPLFHGEQSYWHHTRVTLSDHNGTHVEGPSHCGEAYAKSIHTLPLDQFMGRVLILDLRTVSPEEPIDRKRLEDALLLQQLTVMPGDAVFVRTQADPTRRDYPHAAPGFNRDGMQFLIDQRVKAVGTNAWSIERPFEIVKREHAAGQPVQGFEAHYLACENDIVLIEKLNLSTILPGVAYAFFAPVLIEGTSGGQARVLAVQKGN